MPPAADPDRQPEHPMTSITILGLAAAALAASASAHAQADARRGQVLYDARCGACHSIDAHRVGPMHRGLIGRRAGSLPGYDYSEALARSGIVWDVATLDRWLADPQALVPGQKMGVAVADARDRADLIAYLGAP